MLPGEVILINGKYYTITDAKGYTVTVDIKMRDRLMREIKLGDVVFVKGKVFGVVTSFTPQQVRYKEVNFQKCEIAKHTRYAPADQMIIINKEVDEYKKELIAVDKIRKQAVAQVLEAATTRPPVKVQMTSMEDVWAEYLKP